MKENFANTQEALKKVLRAITNIIIEPAIDYKGIRNACASLSAFFCDVSGFSMNERKNQQHISTGAGLAVGPYAAAFCITG